MRGVRNTQRGLDIPRGATRPNTDALIKSGEISSRQGLLRAQLDCYVEGRERTLETVTDDVRRLYQDGKTHEEIGAELRLTEHQVHNILTTLFAAGLPKRRRVLTDDQARAIHKTYTTGGSIDTLAEEIGFRGKTVRIRMHKLGLPVGTRRVGAQQRPAKKISTAGGGSDEP